MNSSKQLGRDQAGQWASWFQALGDPTRVLILHQLATADGPLAVGQITEQLDVGQSTVSHHLAKLAEVRFVLAEQRGTSSLWQINQECLSCFPSAVDVVMGRVPVEFTEALMQSH